VKSLGSPFSSVRKSRLDVAAGRLRPNAIIGNCDSGCVVSEIATFRELANVEAKWHHSRVQGDTPVGFVRPWTVLGYRFLFSVALFVRRIISRRQP